MSVVAASPAPAANRGSGRALPWLLLLLVVTTPAWFTLHTGNIWEDFFITYRCSLNLVHGEGLTYEAGTRVHAFTSPLGTLVPAAIAWLSGTDDPAIVLGWFRVLGAVVIGVAWWMVLPLFRSTWALLVGAGLWAFDAKIAAFSTNGMETAFLILAIALAWRTLQDRRPVLAGVALGLAMWTRPDGFVFIGALAAATVLVPGGNRWRWRDILIAVAISAAIYTPWFVWAWRYYGSPVPNTILAKGTHLTLRESVTLLTTYPVRFIFGNCAAHDAFLPPYFFFGEWPGWLRWFGRAIAVSAAALIFWRACPRGGRVAGVAFVLGGLYLTITTRAPWYFPGWALLAYGAVAAGVGELLDGRTTARALRWGAAGVIVAVLAAQLWLFFAVATQLRAQQRLIEWDVRARIGRMLKHSAASPRETVFLEPLGYIGFFSGLAMRDTPGLCAPEVVRLRKAGIRSMPQLIAALRTDWVVLRASEVVALSPEDAAGLHRDYFLAASHDARPHVNAISWLPGREFLLMDAYYTIWRRKPAGTERGP